MTETVEAELGKLVISARLDLPLVDTRLCHQRRELFRKAAAASDFYVSERRTQEARWIFTGDRSQVLAIVNSITEATTRTIERPLQHSNTPILTLATSYLSCRSGDTS